MTVYVTVTFWDGTETLKRCDGPEEAVAWLRDVFLPKHREEVAWIHTDRAS